MTHPAQIFAKSVKYTGSRYVSKAIAAKLLTIKDDIDSILDYIWEMERKRGGIVHCTAKPVKLKKKGKKHA